MVMDKLSQVLINQQISDTQELVKDIHKHMVIISLSQWVDLPHHNNKGIVHHKEDLPQDQ